MVPFLRHPARAARVPAFALRPTTLAVHALCLLAAFAIDVPQAAHAAALATSNAPDIPPGALGPALSRFAASAGVSLSFDPAMTDGLQTRGLQGSPDVADGLAQLLAGSGLQAVALPGGGYTLHRVPPAVTTTTAGPVYTLREVRVTGRREGETEGTGSYTSPAITIGKTAQALREHPQSVSVLTRQRLDDQNISDLGSAAAQAVGVTVRDASYRVPAFYTRGFQVESLQLDGGAPMDIALYGNLAVDTATYDRVELLRGAAGLLNGTGNPAGAINLVRKMPTDTPQLQVLASVGRWNNYRTEFDASGPLAYDGKIRGRAVVAYEDRKYFQDHRASTKPLFYGVLEADLGPDATASVGYRELRFRERGAPDGLPRYSNGEDLHLPRHTSLTQDWAYWNGSSKEVFAKLSWRVAERWTLRANATHGIQAGDTKNAFTYGAVDPITRDGVQWSGAPAHYTDRQTMLDLNLSGAFDLFGRTHEVLVGADMQQVRSRWLGTRGYIDAPMVNVFDPDSLAWAEPATYPWMRDYDPDGKTQYGVYGSLRYAVADTTKVILGARVNKYKYHQEYRWTLSLEDFTWDNPWSLASATRYTEPLRVTPFAGIVHDLNDNWSVYASYAQIFQPQADKKSGPMPGTNLKPMRGSNAELGIKGDFLDGDLNTSLAVYRIVQDQRAIADTRYPAQSIMYAGSCCYLQQGKVTSQGIDTEISGEIARGMNVYAGYTYNQNRDRTEDAVFSSITPRHQLKFWGTYQLPGKASDWKVGGGVTLQSRQYVSGTAAVYDPVAGNYDSDTVPYEYTQGGYAIWNAMAEYRVNANWRVTANVNNLTDKRYYRTVSGSTGGNFYGEPRNVMVTVRGNF